MSVIDMYSEFREQFPEATRVADARHFRTWDSVDEETAYSWFESLANALNTQMGILELTDFSSMFSYFDTKFRTGSKEVKNCIDVSFVENLFWQVSPRNAAPVWTILPKNLRQLYIGFHGQPPKLD